MGEEAAVTRMQLYLAAGATRDVHREKPPLFVGRVKLHRFYEHLALLTRPRACLLALPGRHKVVVIAAKTNIIRTFKYHVTTKAVHQSLLTFLPPTKQSKTQLT